MDAFVISSLPSRLRETLRTEGPAAPDGLNRSLSGAMRGRHASMALTTLAVTRWRDIGDGRRTLIVYAQSP